MAGTVREQQREMQLAARLRRKVLVAMERDAPCGDVDALGDEGLPACQANSNPATVVVAGGYPPLGRL